jgi:hypothetical protein
MLCDETRLPTKSSAGFQTGMMVSVVACLTVAGLRGTADDRKPADAPATTKTRAAGPEIDEAIARLRERGAFVREFHPRDNPQYWVQIISTGEGLESREESPNFDDAAMRDVEVVSRGTSLHLHLRRTSVTTAGLARLKSAGKVLMLDLIGDNIDDALLKILPKLPLEGRLALESDVLSDEGLEPLAKCRQLTAVSLSGRSLTSDCLEDLVGLPKLEGVTLGKNFTAAAFEVLARLKDLRDLDVAWQATPELKDLKKFPKLRRITLTGRDQDDETAQTIAESFQSLEQAYLRRTSITSEGVAHLARIATLTTLTLDGAPIDDDIAGSIRRMKQLKWLSVDGCRVGDATLAAASQCPDLWFLALSDSRVTDEGLAELAKLKKLHVLYLTSCRSVTDAGIRSLMRLADSENLLLNLQNSGISEKGARQLQAALPHAQIVWGVPPVPLK